MSGPAGYSVLSAEALGELLDPTREFALDVLVGLSEVPKRLPSRYFYDDAGSRYFQQIMELEEYYPTRCETEILTAHAGDLLEDVGDEPLNLVDLGAGDGKKTMLLLSRLTERRAPFTYVPIDISEGAMQTVVSRVRAKLPGVDVAGLVCDYASGIAWLGAQASERRNLVLFLGSNIGNFDRVRARAFLRQIWNALAHGDLLLIGFDMKKDIEVLLDAYNDPGGVTAAFNLNLLTRINRELGGEFDRDAFRHFGTYDVLSGAMKSYLVSLEAQSVFIGALSQAFAFEPWEPIHTEYSYKYLDTDVVQLAADTGFSIRRQYRDQQRYFLDALWRVEKGPATADPAPRSGRATPTPGAAGGRNFGT
jgi:L-histidine Nalpha-methyltransferase